MKKNDFVMISPFNIAIASGKGGTGKTTLSTNLAAFIAEQQEIVLVDLDAEEPNSGLFIDGSPIFQEEVFKEIPQWDETQCTQCGKCAKACNFHALIKLGPSVLIFPELCHSCFVCSELCPANALPMVKNRIGMIRESELGMLHFVESRLDIGQEQAVPIIAKAKKYVKQKFPNIHIAIFDSPPGTSCPMMEATKDADFVILVTEPTPFGAHDLALAVETMRAMNKDFGVVINRDGIGDNEVENYCMHQQIPILAKIPNNRQVATHYSSGKLIYQDFPEVKDALIQIYNHCLTVTKGEKR